MARKKSFQRSIRINGRVLNSPRYLRKSDADDWYEKQKAKKNHAKAGLAPLIDDTEVEVFQEAAARFMLTRMKEHGGNTWSPEELNLRNHILPVIGGMAVNKITHKTIESLLKNILVTKIGIEGKKVTARASRSTRMKIKALISVIFESILDQENPPIDANPVRLVRESRGGVREKKERRLPKNILGSEEECLRFIQAARDVKPSNRQDAQDVAGRSFVYACSMLMLGPRVSEMIGLRWHDVDFEDQVVTFRWIYEKVDKRLVKRTKSGHDAEREVPLPDELARILIWWRESTPYNGPDDFILSKPGGGHMVHQTVRGMHEWICKRAGVKINRHALRHTFGRMFIARTGNLKALQAILGHSSVQTTEVYSELQTQHLQPFRKDMSLIGARDVQPSVDVEKPEVEAARPAAVRGSKNGPESEVS